MTTLTLNFSDTVYGMDVRMLLRLAVQAKRARAQL